MISPRAPASSGIDVLLIMYRLTILNTLRFACSVNSWRLCQGGERFKFSNYSNSWRLSSRRQTYLRTPTCLLLSFERAGPLGHQVHVIARRRKSDPASEEIEGVQIHRVTDPFNANGFFELRRILKDTSPSIVHTHATSGLFLAAAKKMIGTKFVAQVHGTSHSHYMPIRLDSVSTKVNYSPIKMTYYYLRKRRSGLRQIKSQQCRT